MDDIDEDISSIQMQICNSKSNYKIMTQCYSNNLNHLINQINNKVQNL